MTTEATADPRYAALALRADEMLALCDHASTLIRRNKEHFSGWAGSARAAAATPARTIAEFSTDELLDELRRRLHAGVQP